MALGLLFMFNWPREASNSHSYHKNAEGKDIVFVLNNFTPTRESDP